MIPDDVRKEHAEKCRNCAVRKEIARMADMHFDWIDCPYDCPNDYEHWKAEDGEP